ncbi:MAG: hypothetical protein O3C40_30065, partial [Planctomycetota bacterium]|nr:hypothetical protein [Planctomycetota bacterium]
GFLSFILSILLIHVGSHFHPADPCWFSFTPDAGEGGGDLLLEPLDQFAVGGDQTLLGFDLQHDLLLRRQRRDGD